MNKNTTASLGLAISLSCVSIAADAAVTYLTDGGNYTNRSVSAGTRNAGFFGIICDSNSDSNAGTGSFDASVGASGGGPCTPASMVGTSGADMSSTAYTETGFAITASSAAEIFSGQYEARAHAQAVSNLMFSVDTETPMLFSMFYNESESAGGNNATGSISLYHYSPGYGIWGSELLSFDYNQLNVWQNGSLVLTPGTYQLHVGVSSIAVYTGTYQTGTNDIGLSVSFVPLPAAAWLFGSGLLGLIGVAKRDRGQTTINS